MLEAVARANDPTDSSWFSEFQTTLDTFVGSITSTVAALEKKRADLETTLQTSLGGTPGANVALNQCVADCKKNNLKRK